MTDNPAMFGGIVRRWDGSDGDEQGYTGDPIADLTTELDTANSILSSLISDPPNPGVCPGPCAKLAADGGLETLDGWMPLTPAQHTHLTGLLADD